MSIKVITPLQAIQISNLQEVLVPSEKNKKFIDAYEWAKNLYPTLFVGQAPVREKIDVNWVDVGNVDLDDVERVLLNAANDITLTIAGPANALAAVMSYLNNNRVMLGYSPSAIGALNRFLSRLF